MIGTRYNLVTNITMLVRGLRCEEKEDGSFALLTDRYYNYAELFSVMQK